MILALSATVLIAATNVAAIAQATDKKEAPKTTTLDSWRQALPENEQLSDTPLGVVVAESKDNVESAETAAQIEKRILDLEQRLTEAVKSRDSVALGHLIADDFTSVGTSNPSALQSDKSRFIEWTLKNFELKSNAVEKITAQVYRTTTALVTVQYKQQAVASGAPSDGSFVATDVWVRRGKLWQIVSRHVSPLPKL